MARIKKQKHTRQRHFLAEWRRHCGLTQEAAADRMQITQATLSRIENGLYPYNQDFLERAAEAYNTDPGSLIMRDPTDRDAPWSIENRLKGVPRDKMEIIENVIDAVLRAG